MRTNKPYLSFKKPGFVLFLFLVRFAINPETTFAQDNNFSQVGIFDEHDRAIGQLTIHSGEEVALSAKARVSFGEAWEPVEVLWELVSDSLEMEYNLPQQSARYPLAPVGPGTGILIVSHEALSESLVVTVTVEPPDSFAIKILTPETQRIAGDTLLLEISAFNSDGLVPGTRTGYLMLDDLLATPENDITPPAAMFEDGGLRPMEALNMYSFFNGRDTAAVQIFYAPFQEPNAHRLTFRSNGVSMHSDTTPEFFLLPGDPASVSIELHSGPVSALVLDPAKNDFCVLLNISYDRYGNKIGPCRTDWTIDQNLGILGNSDNVAQVFFEPDSADSGAEGFIYAGPEGGLRDSVYITIGPVDSLPQCMDAFTRDLDGNGFLDAIELHYDRPFVIPAEWNIRLKPALPFFIDSIRYLHGTEPLDSVVVVYFAEIENGDFGTGDCPVLLIRNPLNQLVITEMECRDGAGPVITSAYVAHDYPYIPGTHGQGRMEVEFSEPVCIRGPIEEASLFVFFDQSNDIIDTIKHFYDVIKISGEHCTDDILELNFWEGVHRGELTEISLAPFGDIVDQTEQQNQAVPGNIKVTPKVEHFISVVREPVRDSDKADDNPEPSRPSGRCGAGALLALAAPLLLRPRRRRGNLPGFIRRTSRAHAAP